MVKKDGGTSDLSIVILNHNTGNFLVECLRSLAQVRDEINLDIWVVDNASKDESLKLAQKYFPGLNYIVSGENLGFARGNNLALKQVKTEYILILNPDTKILPGTLPRVVNYLEEHSKTGAVSCRVELADGSVDWASHRGFPTPWASFLYYFLKDDKLYHLSDRSMEEVHEVDAISGSFFLTRKSVLDKVGLFDEDYFMYAEDLDLSFRIKKVGLEIVYIPDVKIIHYKGVSSGLKEHSQQISQATIESKLRALNAFYETMIIFYQKNLAASYPFFVNRLVTWGINLKWLLAKRKLLV